MATNERTTGATAAGNTDGHLGCLNDLDEFKVADGYPDPRGWNVKTDDGRTIGTVDDLIVDTQAMRVRYVSVEVDRSLAPTVVDAETRSDRGGPDGTHTLIPVRSVQLDDAHDDVLVHGYTAEQVAALPRYAGAITRAYEASLLDGHRTRAAGAARGVAGALSSAAAAAGAAVAGAADQVKDAVTDHSSRHTGSSTDDHGDSDDQSLYAKGRQAGAPDGAPDEQRLTLAEEQLTVGKRQTAAGAVELRKTVETEHVHEQVALTHDEVSIERRPITDPSQVGVTADQLGEDEVRVILMEEQLVITKIMVPREEIIIRKRQVTEQQTVEADVRRERLVIADAATPGLVHQPAAVESTTRRTTQSTMQSGPDIADRR